jgi:uncharacterized Tic20 family protein
MADETPTPPSGDLNPPPSPPPSGDPPSSGDPPPPPPPFSPAPVAEIPATDDPPYGLGRVEASTDKTMCILCHALGIVGAVANGFSGGWFGWIGLLGPLIIWLVKKDESPAIAAHGKETVNFQIWILILSIILLIGTVLTCGLGIVIALPAFIILSVYGLVMNIVGALKAADGKLFRYPLTLRVL